MTMFTTPRRPSLAEALGTGLGRGFQTGIGQALQTAALAQKPLTPYQQILGVQRERDLQRQIGGYTGGLLREEMKAFEISPLEKARIDKTTYNLVRQGIDLPTAASQSIQEYLTKKEFLETIDVPKAPILRKEATKQKVIAQLKENQIVDPFDIQSLMSDKGWKGKDIQDVYRQLRTPRAITKERPTARKKIKFNPQNTTHIKARDKALKQTKGNKAEANKILAERFEL